MNVLLAYNTLILPIHLQNKYVQTKECNSQINLQVYFKTQEESARPKLFELQLTSSNAQGGKIDARFKLKNEVRGKEREGKTRPLCLLIKCIRLKRPCQALPNLGYHRLTGFSFQQDMATCPCLLRLFLTILEMLRVFSGFSMTISVVMCPSTASLISSSVQLMFASLMRNQLSAYQPIRNQTYFFPNKRSLYTCHRSQRRNKRR